MRSIGILIGTVLLLFYEKIQWLKLNYRVEAMTDCSDKIQGKTICRRSLW